MVADAYMKWKLNNWDTSFPMWKYMTQGYKRSSQLTGLDLMLSSQIIRSEMRSKFHLRFELNLAIYNTLNSVIEFFHSCPVQSLLQVEKIKRLKTNDDLQPP